ncbi:MULTISPECIES: FAD-dependent oxidoreductase [Streptomyces]|uniref:Protoporphyrinogen oxidase n=2 Tax=Streptomyces TaxID=1883 RepID=A0A1D8G881_9ACTN|nr:MULTISPECIES: FAD-dependent oxidoreductase [Streptomyces]AOT61659.1 protoporphyrinogen oxidase [Streptomyces rubrolavendulae]UQS29418.1 FAD-dependent oxidoreductase [Streptomyces fradiae]
MPHPLSFFTDAFLQAGRARRGHRSARDPARPPTTRTDRETGRNAGRETDLTAGMEGDGMRIVVVGAGLCGLTLAWLLEEGHEVVVLEERGRLGGNIDSRPVPGAAGPRWADVGVREVVPAASPLWSRLFRLQGFAADDLVAVPAGRSLVREAPDGREVLLSPAQDAAGPGAGAVGSAPARAAVRAFTERAAAWAEEGLGWDVPLGAALDPLPFGAPLADVVCALPASLFGCTLDEARDLSARAVGSLYATPPGAPPAPAAVRPRDGFGALTTSLAGSLRGARVHPGAGAARIERDGGRYRVVDVRGHAYPADCVVLAVPADRAEALLRPLAGTGGLRAALRGHRYREAAYSLHLDPYGMPAERADRAAVNITVAGRGTRTTVRRPAGDGPDHYVTAAPPSAARPLRELARTTLRTHLPTPAAHAARREVERRSGEGLLFLAGQCAATVDTQEGAVASALAVARSLVPSGRRTRSLGGAAGDAPAG